MRVIEDKGMVIREQVKFPRSKCRRIRRKWAKQPKNWRTRPMPDLYRMGETVIGHPMVITELCRQIASARPAQPFNQGLGQGLAAGWGLF